MRATALLLGMLMLCSNEAALVPGQPAPQQRAFFGIRGGIVVEEGSFIGPLIGVEGLFSNPSDRFVFNPNIELAVADNFIFILSGDFALILTPQSDTLFWVGAGVGLTHRGAILRETQTDLVGNLLVGFGAGGGRVRPYVQAKAMLGRENHLSAVFGVRF